MNIGLIDADNYKNLDSCFPNLPLMKISAWNKSIGNTVEWYDPSRKYDIVYMSKVFSFTEGYKKEINADRVIKGGSGYCIKLENGMESYDKDRDKELPYYIEHIYPDYSIYPNQTKDTAYGFMSRGCPRGCNFCHVKDKEGLRSHKVADLDEFWRGQKNIVLCDPNTLACKDWRNILSQLSESKAYVDFNQGVDIRMMTQEKAEMLCKIKIKSIHFAYDRYQDKAIIEPKFRKFKDITGWKRGKVQVYVLSNFDTSLDQDLDRVMFLKSLDFSPYIMLYNKKSLKRGDIHFKLSRWVNNRAFFWKFKNFDEYLINEKYTH